MNKNFLKQKLTLPLDKLNFIALEKCYILYNGLLASNSILELGTKLTLVESLNPLERSKKTLQDKGCLEENRDLQITY